MSGQDQPKKKRPLAVSPAILPRSKEIGDALWVYLWAYDRVTRQCLCQDGTLVGLVLGGSVVSDDQIARELGRSVKWVRRWRRHAVNVGLLRACRFPYGNLLAPVLPGKKFARHEVKESPRWAQLPTASKLEKRRSGKSRVPISGFSEVPRGAIWIARNGIPERSKSVTRRKTVTMTAQLGLGQKTLPPLPSSPPQGGETSRSLQSASAPPAGFSESKKPTKQKYELSVDVRSLTPFGHVVAHVARDGGEFGDIVSRSVQKARELGFDLPSDPSREASLILEESTRDCE